MGRSALWGVFGIPAAACSVWTVLAGKDVNWDLLNYHYYVPYQLLAGRIEQDFFAASAQSYLNPIGFLPFYLMVSAGWHSVIVSVVLAVVHGLSLSLLFLLARRLFSHLTGCNRTVFAILASALGAATAVYWPTVGSSFLDPLLVPPILGAVLLLLDGDKPGLRAASAGALLGTAAALKYSNAIYGLAALPLALAMPGLAPSARPRVGLAYAAGGVMAMALLAGPWFALLVREFGNPVFPLMNAWFRSPYAPAINMVSARFTPEGVAEAFALPFGMVALDRHLYTETFAPDIRLAVLAAGLLALPAVVLLARGQEESRMRGADIRVFGFFAMGWMLWIASSANARYGMALLLLAGVCLARLAQRLLPASAARIALGVLLAAQVGTLLLASPPRWFIADPWSKRWLPYEVPARAQREPALYLTLEVLSMAAVAPFVHSSSSFVNLSGQHTLPADSPKIAALLERHGRRVRVLGRRLELVEGKPNAAQVRVYDSALRRIGYRVDVSDCFAILWRPDRDDLLSQAANRLVLASPSPERLSVASCALRPAPRDAGDAERERLASALFDRIERRCPELFRGQTAVTEPFGSGWSRNYGGLDARLEAYADRVLLHRYRTATVLELGRLSEWLREDGLVPTVCQRSGREEP